MNQSLNFEQHTYPWLCVPPGSVPVPESLLLSPPPLLPLEPVSTAQLLAAVSPARLQGLRRDCGGCLQCVHDTVATGSTELGLQALEAKNLYHHHTQTFGEMLAQKMAFQWGCTNTTLLQNQYNTCTSILTNTDTE